MIKTVLKLGVIVATMLVSQAHASIMLYQYTGTGSGTIGAETFTDSSFVINQLVDTANIQSCEAGAGCSSSICAGCSSIDDISTSITLDGFGTYNFATDLRTFVNTGNVGLSRAGINGLDLYYLFNVGETWDMSKPTNVVSNYYARLFQWEYEPVYLDNAQQLTFTAGGRGSFQAISAVPEPEQWAMMLLGLPLMGWISRRKKNQTQC